MLPRFALLLMLSPVVTARFCESGECMALAQHEGGRSLLQRDSLLRLQKGETAESQVHKRSRETDGAAAARGEAITFITVEDSFFAANLGASSLWLNRASLPHEWILIANPEKRGISALYAEAQSKAKYDLLVFIHPDVFLPEDFYEALRIKLTSIEAIDPHWGVLGTAGVPKEWNPAQGTGVKIISSIHTLDFVYYNGRDAAQVQTLDEHLLILRKSSKVSFDPGLPGFDLYGSDICLNAEQKGRKSYLLNVVVKHKTMDASGLPYQMTTWLAKFNSPETQQRAAVSLNYLMKKWCSSGLLPSYGTAFDIVGCA